MTNLRRTAFALAIFTLLGAPFSAFASPGYPDNVKSDLHLAHGPECTLCHKNNNGGKGTVTRPFGLELRQLGAKGSSPGSLRDALREYDQKRLSVDGDCDPDVQELRDGRNPNVADDLGEGGSQGGGCDPPPGFKDLPVPLTGCSASRRGSARSDDDFVETLAAFGVAAVWLSALRLVARRRRRAV